MITSKEKKSPSKRKEASTMGQNAKNIWIQMHSIDCSIDNNIIVFFFTDFWKFEWGENTDKNVFKQRKTLYHMKYCIRTVWEWNYSSYRLKGYCFVHNKCCALKVILISISIYTIYTVHFECNKKKKPPAIENFRAQLLPEIYLISWTPAVFVWFDSVSFCHIEILYGIFWNYIWFCETEFDVRDLSRFDIGTK